jgi:hypothetical protein
MRALRVPSSSHLTAERDAAQEKTFGRDLADVFVVTEPRKDNPVLHNIV